MHMGTIEVGDMDLGTVEGHAGDAIVVRIAETSAAAFTPQLRIYGPTGTLLDSSFSTIGAEVAVTAASSGTFLVVVGDVTGSWQGSGAYRLTLAKTGDPVVVSAGDEGGRLTNGVMHIGTIDVGDLDLWTVEATAGQAIVVRMGETSPVLFSPELRIYGPNGALLDSAFSTVGAEVVATAGTSGTFLVVAGDITASWQGSGEYRITLAKTGDPAVVSAGDEGGAMIGAGVYAGSIGFGDMDVFTFTACAGDAIVLRMDEVIAGSSLTPQLRLYGRDGVLLNSPFGAATAQISRTAPASGNYLVVAADITSSWSGSGDYTLTVNGLSDGLKLCIPVVAGTNVHLGSIGGSAGGNFVLLTHTNVGAPGALWSPIRTNQFDAFGTFTWTNLFNVSELQRYFRLGVP
jgi:hypothetical protein